MTITTASASTRSGAARALLTNATYCATSGVAAMAASGPLADSLDLPRWLLMATGAALVAYAPLIAWFGSHRPVRQADLMAAFIGDIAWCVGAVVLITWPGLLSPAARTALTLLSLPVGALAVWEWRARADL